MCPWVCAECFSSLEGSWPLKQKQKTTVSESPCKGLLPRPQSSEDSVLFFMEGTGKQECLWACMLFVCMHAIVENSGRVSEHGYYFIVSLLSTSVEERTLFCLYASMFLQAKSISEREYFINSWQLWRKECFWACMLYVCMLLLTKLLCALLLTTVEER